MHAVQVSAIQMNPMSEADMKGKDGSPKVLLYYLLGVLNRDSPVLLFRLTLAQLHRSRSMLPVRMLENTESNHLPAT
jgi:hypothetical protein